MLEPRVDFLFEIAADCKPLTLGFSLFLHTKSMQKNAMFLFCFLLERGGAFLAAVRLDPCACAVCL